MPPAIIPLLLTKEIAISLRTDSRKEAVSRSHAVWLRTEEVFDMAKSPIARAQALVVMQEMVRSAPWEKHGLNEVYRRALYGDGRDLSDLLTHARDDIADLGRDDLARVLLHVKELTARLDAHGISAVVQAKATPDEAFVRESVSRDNRRRAVQELDLTEAIDLKQTEAKEAKEAPAPSVADFIEKFISSKITDGYTPGTVHQTRMTLRLWGEFMGEIPVKAVTGRHAGDFRDLLLRLPSSHGKASSKGKHISGFEAVEIADKKKEAGKPVARLSMKTAKRHFSTMQQLWKHLVQRSEVSSNPFSGFSFPGTKSKKSGRDDWADTDLLKLLQSARMRTSQRDFWIVAIAMWSGMRLEEACRIRPEHDIHEVDGIPFFFIQEQDTPKWSPKTEAGERAVPVHSMLIEAGILNVLGERAQEERLVPGTRYSGPDRKLGVEFSREFSRLKVSLGVSSRTTFHSFRHSVSTILRNEEAGIRGEWIDAVLGHEGGKSESMGVTVYLKRIGVANLKRTVERIRYPEAVENAFRALK